MIPGGPPAPAGVHHVAILVSDLAAVETFYRNVLGLAVLRRWPERADRPEGPERSVWLDMGGAGFLALEKAKGQAHEDTTPEDGRGGLHMIALRISAPDRALWEHHLAAAGVAVTHRTSFTLYVRDPEGNRVGLSHFPDATDG
jgi:catechol 2,3-dioxygenase-like lactoylglutathione lyase family enzyme